MPKQKLICSCNRTLPLDAKALGRALGMDAVPRIHTGLCRRDLAAYHAAVDKGEDLVVACTQETALFDELRGTWNGSAPVRFVNVREAAGWSAEAHAAGPKIAALLALADLPEPEPVPTVSYRSDGQLLILGPGSAALAWAERLGHQLSVSVLVTAAGGPFELPSTRAYPVYSGTPRSVTGHLGAFEVAWDQANPIDLEMCTRCNACIRACPEQAIDHAYQIDLEKCRSHRRCVAACADIGAIDFARAEPGRRQTFDLVLDLSREPLIRLPQPPQGYFAPGDDPLDQALAATQLAQLTGEFEKPRFFSYREKICAHSRSEIVGCSRCIEVCSTGAIASDVEHNRVTVDPHLCMGCGGCATVCPSGAMTYAYPRVSDMGARIGRLLDTYRAAGGQTPCLLFHNGEDGRELIARLARRGRGLPASVIPLEVAHVASIGLDLMLGALALGAARVAVLSAGSEPPGYAEVLQREMELAGRIVRELALGDGRFELIQAADAAALERAVWEAPRPQPLPAATFHLSNDKRATIDFALDHLMRHAGRRPEEVALSAGAPYGAVTVDREKCTLCLACVGACPESALIDDKERPQLRFIERNCVQCGLCEKTCPEDAIALVPRLLLTPDATRPVVLNEDEIFGCVRCGKPFGNRRIVENLLGRLTAHSMFQDPAALRRLQMCQDCRVIDMLERNADGTIFDVTARGGPQ